MIEIVNQEQFVAKLKEQVCLAAYHHRYYTIRARKYYWIDYGIKVFFGVITTLGAAIAATGTSDIRWIGALMTGASGFALGALLPVFKWETIVSGQKAEREEWARILQGFEGLLMMWSIANRDEMFMQEFQKVEELRKAAQLNDRNLPEDAKLRKKVEARVRQYYQLDPPSPPAIE